MQAGSIGLLVLALLQPAAIYAPAEPRSAPDRGAIKGRVLDEDGEPVSAVRISAGRPSDRTVTGFLSYTRPVFADDRGYFEIGNVPAGDWFVNAQVTRMRFEPGIGQALIEYESTYYPGVVDPAEAQPITIAPKTTVDHVRFTMRRAPRYTLRVPVNLSEMDPASVQIVLTTENGLSTFTHTSSAVRDDGQFRMSRLKAGNYSLWVRGRSGTDLVAGHRDIAIGADTLEPELVLRPTATIAGRVVAEPDELALPTGLRVSAAFIVDNDEPASFPLDSTGVSDEGRFELRGVFARRGLRLDGLPQPWTVRRVVVSGRALPPTAIIDVREGQTLDATFVIARER